MVDTGCEKRFLTTLAMATGLLTLAFSVSAEEAIFPDAFHVVRTIEDPISARMSTVDEYYRGNRVVTVADGRVSIADYSNGTLTEIDHASGTWSRTTFETLAATTEKLSPARDVPGALREGAERIRAEARAARGVAGRSAEVWRVEFEEDHPAGLRSVEVAVDRSIPVTEQAAEILAGSAFPGRPSDVSRAVRTAIGRQHATGTSATSRTGQEGFPLEQIVTWAIDGEEIRLVNRVVRIDDEQPDPALLAIPEDATEVENHLVKMQRILEELDRLPGVEDDR